MSTLKQSYNNHLMSDHKYSFTSPEKKKPKPKENGYFHYIWNK